MPFVQRDQKGAITALFAEAREDAREWLPPDNAELQDFVAAGSGLAATDMAMARVAEDLIELLVAKGVILFTELPPHAQQKLLKRRDLRGGLSLALGLTEGQSLI